MRFRASRRPSPRRRAGLTFLELMIVIAVIAFLSVMVMANLDGLTNESRVSAAARNFGNTLLTLRDTAALQARELSLEIDVDESRWRMVDVPSPMDVPDPEVRREKTWYGDWTVLPEGVVLASLEFNRRDVERRGVVTVSFDADGQLAPAGFIAFFRHEEAEDDEDGLSVEVTGLTGLVSYVAGKKRSEEVRDPDDF